MADPQSVDEWLMLVSQHEESAKLLSKSVTAASQGYFHAGTAVECMLKAYIMRKERLNSWPSKQARNELYTHDIRKLKAIADIQVSITDSNSSEWILVEAWDRLAGYDPKPMPRKQTREMIEAVFGENGVVTWLRQNLK